MAFFLCGSPRFAWCHTWKGLKGQHLLLLLPLGALEKVCVLPFRAFYVLTRLYFDVDNWSHGSCCQ